MFPIEMSMVFFSRNRKLHPKMHMESQGTHHRQNYLKKRTKLGSTLPDFKTFYKGIIIESVALT